MNVGKLIKEIRKSRGLQQKWVAQKANITNVHLSYIENGHKEPPLDTILRICKVLGIPAFVLLYLATEEGDVPEKNKQYFKENKERLDELLKTPFLDKT